MLSEALQRNAKHEARLSNISGCDLHAAKRRNSEILRFAQNDNAGYRSPLQPFQHFNRSTTSPFVPGMGIVRNRNCPACKSLRRSGAALVGARQCAEILSGGDHFQKDASQRFRVAGSITARATSRILSKALRSARREPSARAPPTMET